MGCQKSQIIWKDFKIQVRYYRRIALLFLGIPYLSRDTELMAVESQIRAAIRDCINYTSRNPFNWGGIEALTIAKFR
jgi:hypothetical protein